MGCCAGAGGGASASSVRCCTKRSSPAAAASSGRCAASTTACASGPSGCHPRRPRRRRSGCTSRTLGTCCSAVCSCCNAQAATESSAKSEGSIVAALLGRSCHAQCPVRPLSAAVSNARCSCSMRYSLKRTMYADQPSSCVLPASPFGLQGLSRHRLSCWGGDPAAASAACAFEHLLPPASPPCPNSGCLQAHVGAASLTAAACAAAASSSTTAVLRPCGTLIMATRRAPAAVAHDLH